MTFGQQTARSSNFLVPKLVLPLPSTCLEGSGIIPGWQFNGAQCSWIEDQPVLTKTVSYMSNTIPLYQQSWQTVFGNLCGAFLVHTSWCTAAPPLPLTRLRFDVDQC